MLSKPRNTVSSDGTTSRFSVAQLLLLGFLCIYALLPFWWVVVTIFKNNGQLFTTFGLWFASPSHFMDNLTTLFTYDGGLFTRWFVNSLLYSTTISLGVMLTCAMAGYGFSKYQFAGRDTVFSFILATIMVPSTSLVLPLFLVVQGLGSLGIPLINTPWAFIFPSLANPFALYLMRLFWDSFPTEIIESARIDGASEAHIFWKLGLPLVQSGLVTVALFAFVGSWNNFFLPLMMLNSNELYPLTLGLSVWNNIQSGSERLYTVIVLASLISFLPLLIGFLFLGRYWQGGVSAGAVKG
jgi:multiple sugar transport system permease protein